jgi:5-methylcytosine-specific restriction endonuclease McrA
MKDYTGQKFGRLTAVRFLGLERRFPKSGKSYTRRIWEFLCECGKPVRGSIDTVSTGRTKSCGCAYEDYKRNRGKMTRHEKYLRHRDKVLESGRTYRSTHKALYQNYRLTHKAESKQYQRSHLDYFRIKASERRARIRGCTIEAKSILAWTNKFKSQKTFLCHWCRRRFPIKKFTVDHVVPLVQKGVHAIGNLAAACEDCNSTKQRRRPGQWSPDAQQLLSL